MGKTQFSSDVGTLPFPVEQNGREIGIDREVILRILGLDLVYHAVPYCASDSHRKIGEVDVRPLLRQDFADTKSQALRDNYHGAVRSARRSRIETY
jgi:hypothetical protein